MSHRPIFAIMLLCSGTAAIAAPDLATTITPPAGVRVYEPGRYNVTVTNIGNHTANGVTLSIQLPPTNTSPQVHVLGILGAFDARCTLASTVLSCPVGQLRKRQSRSFFFDIALPVSSAPIAFSATAPPVAGESVTGNNTASSVASLFYPNLPVAPPRVATNRHCTGTGLTSFFECALYPSSISQHTIRLTSGNTIDFISPAASGLTGDWRQPTSNSLTFNYYDMGVLAATFHGRSVDGSCYEGLTTFPGSAYVAPYQVCLQ